MKTPNRRYCSGLVCAGLLAGLVSVAHGADTSLSVHATVIAVQCTPQQRSRIRACAPAEEKYTIAAATTMLDPGPRTEQHGRTVRYEIFARDPLRQVVIKTVLY